MSDYGAQGDRFVIKKPTASLVIFKSGYAIITLNLFRRMRQPLV
jgi:hypothetical protein